MIDYLYPEGIPNGFLQLGDCWLVGCGACGHPLAVAFSYPDNEILDSRLEMFINLAFGLSGFPRNADAPWQDLAGVVVTYNLSDVKRPWVWVVYPAQQERVAVHMDQVVDWIQAVGLQVTGHRCGPITSAA